VITPKHLILKFIMLNMALAVALSASDGMKYSKVRLDFPNLQEMLELKEKGIALDRPREIDGSMEVTLDNYELDLLRESGKDFEIIVDDVIQNYDDKIRMSDAEMLILQEKMREEYEVNGFEFGSMGGYYTLDEAIAEMDSMRLLYPQIISARQAIGTTHEGRDIWMMKISDYPEQEEDEPQILYTAVHHAREVQSMATLLYYMYYLLENYGHDSFVTFLVDNRELYFVPMVNPDGYYQNEYTNPGGGGMWRKNRRDNGDGSWGVDLNRNYGYQWGYNDTGSSPLTTSNVYRGLFAFSEPETQAIRDLCINHEFQLAFNFHSYWNWIFYPWLYNETSPPDLDIYVDLLQEITLVNQYGFAPPPPSNGYQFNGNTTDWMYGEQTVKNKIFSMTPEVGRNSDGFWPSQSRIYPLAQENVHACLTLALGPGIIATGGQLLVETASISSGYLRPGIDTVYCSIQQGDSLGIGLEVMALVESSDHTFRDSIFLYDDGLHQDGNASDGLFAGQALAPHIESDFDVHIYATSDSQSNSFLNNIGSFITLGPIRYAGITDANHEFPQPGESYLFYCALQNQSSSSTIPAVSARLNSDHNNIVVVSETVFFGDIEATESLSNAGLNYFNLLISDFQILDSATYILSIDIYSEGEHYWSDSLEIALYPVVGAQTDKILPGSVELSQNWPNPFNPVTQISYTLPQAANVQLTIFNLRGQKIAVLEQAHQPHGKYSIIWDGADDAGVLVSTGVYFARLQVGEYSKTIKMVYLK